MRGIIAIFWHAVMTAMIGGRYHILHETPPQWSRLEASKPFLLFGYPLGHRLHGLLNHLAIHL